MDPKKQERDRMNHDRDRTLYLVDGTYLLFRAWHSLPASLAVTGEMYRRNRPGLEALLREGAGTGREPEGIAGEALAWLHDAAHDRLPTNAVRGLASVLIKLIREERPAYMGVAFDLPGRVHRDDHYGSFVEKHPHYAPQLAGYKATRPETPVEVRVQYPFARVVCSRALGIPVLEAVGFEEEDQITRAAYRKGLLEHAALGLFSKELATIREDAPVSVNLDDVWAETPDKDLLKKVFLLLAFEALLRDVEALPGPSVRGAGEN